MSEINISYFKSIIDQDRAAVVICNLNHEIIYMNPAAVVNYAKRGGDKLIGRSLLECHNKESQEKIRQVTEWFAQDESENMSRVFMLKPADGIEGVKEAILTAVKDAGPNACPPMVVGVGIGGTFEKCAYLAKKALTRDLNEESPVEYVRDLEKEMLEKINKLGIGPGGLGGTQTALAINIETYPTHIAGLPVAVNICCHVNRHSHRVI